MSKIRFVTRRVCELHNKHTFVTSLGLCTATFQRQLRLDININPCSFINPMLSWFQLVIILLSYEKTSASTISICYQFVIICYPSYFLPGMNMTPPPDDEIKFRLVPGDAATSCMELAYDTIIGRWQETTFPMMGKGNWLAPVGWRRFFF